MSATDRLREGQTFGRYQIVRLIGEGGMGAVYEVIHPALKKRFAIKTLLPEGFQKEELRVRFLREGEAASSINHPNVVAVSDVGTEDGIPYLVMELLEGQTLGDHLAERGALSVEEALALLLPVISAVATGHDRGVIHRDLKPQNIFLAKGPWGDQIPKVLDFGVSKLTGEDNAVITQTLSVLGTAAYMSPEQARGAKRVGFPSDQYALGLIFYEMLTGTRAHAGENSLEILHNVASGAIRPVRELKPNLPNDLIPLLTRMLAANPADRHPSLQECGRALLPFADDRTRMAMTNAFTAPAKGAMAGPPASADERRPSTAASPSEPAGSGSGSGVVRTLALPVAGTNAPSDTTLRQTAVEASRADGPLTRSSRAKVRLGLTVGIGALAVAGSIIWIANKSQTTPPAVPQQQSPGAASVTPAPKPPSTTTGSSIPFEIHAVPPEAEIVLDDRAPTRGRLEIILPLAGSSHQIRVSADGYLPKVVAFGPDDRPPAEIRLDRAVAVEVPRSSAQDDPRVAHEISPPSGAAKAGAAKAESKQAAKGDSRLTRKPPPSVPGGSTHSSAQGTTETKGHSTAAKATDTPAAPQRGSNNARILQ